jgi:anthranilate phosphoribosyltransferase
MIREAIAKLVENQPLTREDALQSVRDIMGGIATPAQIASYITALRIRGETADVIAGSAQAMREHFTPVERPGEIIIDTCGTGGDGAHTFNISTAVAFVAAGAGAIVAKHGNRSVSSRSGSADVLEALGVNIGVDASVMSRCLREIGIAFLFAPSLHPAMKHAIGPRKEIGIRTIFNILGPLSNPAGARHGVIGVYSKHLVPVLAEAAAKLGAQHLFVVHGSDGLDEFTTTGISHVAEVRDGQVKLYDVNPRELGIPVVHRNDLGGGTPQENAAIIRRILDGEKFPGRDIVVLNAAAALVAGQKASTLKAGIKLAEQSLDSGAARQKLEALAAATRP